MAGVDLARGHGASRADALACHATRARVVGEFRCSDCGYGIVSRGALPICPMRRGSSCDESPWQRFTRGSR